MIVSFRTTVRLPASYKEHRVSMLQQHIHNTVAKEVGYIDNGMSMNW